MTSPFMRPPAGTPIPAGRPPCREWFALDQHTPAGMWPCQKLCRVCGRVTARRDEQGWPWCGGNPPTNPKGTS